MHCDPEKSIVRNVPLNVLANLYINLLKHSFKTNNNNNKNTLKIYVHQEGEIKEIKAIILPLKTISQICVKRYPKYMYLI